MSCSVGLKDIEDFTNELNDAPRKTAAQVTVKRNKKVTTENPEIDEIEKGFYLYTFPPPFSNKFI